ncbi:MAG: alanine racemase [Patescibacteria group bacterium]|nr:alanine racemase [Patescibacteria group bacterium]
MNPSTRTWVEVSKSALRHNAGELKRCIGSGTRFMAVVKSNAYGHGIKETVRSVGSVADWFGVDSLPEAEAVRSAVSNKKPVLIMGFTPSKALARVVRQGFSQVVYDRETVSGLSHAASKRNPAKIHVKVETGTSRQGVCPEEMSSFIRFIAKQPNLKLEGMSTHYANIEDTNDSSYAMKQLSKFRDAVRMATEAGRPPEMLHTACSAAILMYPETHFDIVRAGISLYGLWSSGVTRRAVLDSGKKIRLKPAMTWKSSVAQVKKIKKGTPVSYGLTERVTRDTIGAVVPVGYWDGYDRKMSSVGNVLIHGERAKVLGRICMNMCVVDVTDMRGVKVENEVVILGRQNREEITAEELADRIGTINYEVVTRINPTLPRILVD